MRDIINATLGSDHFLRCDTYALARNGEGLTPCLSISIPDNLSKYWAYIDFKKPNGETFKTPRIEVDEGNIVYNIPCSVLDVEGKLEIQVVFQNENNEIWKSYVKEFAVRYSINAVDDIPDKQDFITEAQKVIDEAKETANDIERRANEGEFNGEDGANGYTPVKGVDYYTEEEKAEIVYEAKPKWKTLSSGTLDESTGGVAKITAELNESIEDISEFRFYLEIPTGSPTGTSTTMYVNAVIDNASPALKNCLLSVSHSGTPRVGMTTRTIATMRVITSPAGTRYIQSVVNQLDVNYGINTRTNPLSTLCLWDVSKSSKNFTINISNYNFESGTKWILEGR